MDLSTELLSLFSAEVTETEDDRCVIEVPRREVDTGAIEAGGSYRIALVAAETDDEPTAPPAEPQPPVEPGEIRYVEIEDLGKQDDGIARVERGYVVIVPDAAVGDRVKVEITAVQPNFAVGERIGADR